MKKSSVVWQYDSMNFSMLSCQERSQTSMKVAMFNPDIVILSTKISAWTTTSELVERFEDHFLVSTEHQKINGHCKRFHHGEQPLPTWLMKR